MITRRADFRPQTADPETLTAELVWSTGADVERRDRIGPYVERLRMDPEAVDLSRLIGAPLLNAHCHRDLGDVLGCVLDASVNGREGTATVRFSERARPIFDDVAAGILRNVSVGYHVAEWTAATEDGRRVRIATRWQPLELSLVPVAADRGATVRGASPMSETDTETADRSVVDLEIRRLCAMGGAHPEPLIALGATVEHARAAALSALVERAGPETRPVQVIADHGDPRERAAAYGEAVFTRLHPEHVPGERARPYVAMSLREMAAGALRHAGARVQSLSADTVLTRALHTTSDFPLILGDAVGRELRQAYAAAPGGVRALARQTSNRDFRAKTVLEFGGALALLKVNEHGEFTSGTLTEAGESIRVATYGRIFGYTRQLMINDDLGALERIGAIAAASARQLEADVCVELLATGSGLGPTMGDGKRLFHADHRNVAATGTAPDEGIAAAVLAMRTQVGLDKRVIGIEPTAVVIPAALEHEVSRFFSSAHVPATPDGVNPYASLRIVVDPRLDAKSASRWYLVGERWDGLWIAYLEGNAAPVTETRAGFEIDGVQIKVRLDYRAWYSNVGA